MIVEVIGIYEQNKGALLMLEAIRSELRDAGVCAQLAVSYGMPQVARRHLGVLGVLPTSGSRKLRLLNILPSWLLRLRCLIKAEEVSIVLDASGFGYGDFWGEAKLRRRLVQRLEGWKTPERIAVMLPQALGPFTSDGIAARFRQALGLLDLAFVRDQVSMTHVLSVSDSPAIRRAPDFTNLLHTSLPPLYARFKGSSFVIPNEKMAAGERAIQREAYVKLMALSADAIRARGLTPRLLVHEGAKDRQLASEINEHTAQLMEIVDVPSPLDTKALIASANLIVSSRFHGLVSALAAGVPALACGWSHKYAELMTDYGSGEMIIAVDHPETWGTVLSHFLDQAANPAFRDRLNDSAEKQRSLSRAMWAEVLDLIRSRNPAE